MQRRILGRAAQVMAGRCPLWQLVHVEMPVFGILMRLNAPGDARMPQKIPSILLIFFSGVRLE